MPYYKCMLEVFFEVEALSEKDAEIKAMEELNESFKAGNSGFICWEIEKPETPPGIAGVKQE